MDRIEFVGGRYDGLVWTQQEWFESTGQKNIVTAVVFPDFKSYTTGVRYELEEDGKFHFSGMVGY